MSRSMARMLYDICTTHKQNLNETCMSRAVAVETDSEQSVYTFSDGSKLGLNNYGIVRVDSIIMGAQI